jgi:hypothetical protein
MFMFRGEYKTFEAHQMKLHDDRHKFFSLGKWNEAVGDLRKAQTAHQEDVDRRMAVAAANEKQNQEDRQIVLAALMWFEECLDSGSHDMNHLNETLEDVGLTVDTLTKDHFGAIFEEITFGS